MTRSDLVLRLAERFAQLTQRDTEFAVKTMLDAMSDALARGHRIEIRGFGSFSISRRPPRVGRNPRSGAQVTIPEKLVPHFKPGKALRESVDALERLSTKLWMDAMARVVRMATPLCERDEPLGGNQRFRMGMFTYRDTMDTEE